MGAQNPFYLVYLQEVFQKRSQKNAQYSMRAFASALDVDHSLLSKIMSRKTVMSLKSGEKIIKKLAPHCFETQKKFILSISEEQACKSLNNLDPSFTDCDD